MIALWVALVKDRTKLPVYQVAGNLFAGGGPAFESDATSDDVASAFDKSQTAWDGHCWMSIGNHIGDLSIFRTAYARPDNSRLRSVITCHFGQGRGLLLFPTTDLPKVELDYQPKHVLTETQIDSLVLGARSLFTAGRF
jgi:hypothetical protein